MKFFEFIRRNKKIITGASIGFIFGFLKVILSAIILDSLPAFIAKMIELIFWKFPDEFLCWLFGYGTGEGCGYFALYYGFIYNTIFYCVIGAFCGYLADRWKVKK